MKNKRLLIALGVVLVVALVGVGIFSASKFIVGKSYSARDVVEEKNEVNQNKQSLPEDTETESETEVTEEGETEFNMEFTEENEDTNMGKVVQLYDPEDVDKRQQDFLGMANYEELKPILDVCKAGDLDWSDVPTGEHQSPGGDIIDYSISRDETLDVNEVMSHDMVTMINSLAVVGLYDNSKVLYVYNYPNALQDKIVFFVDYSDTDFSLDSPLGWDFGDVVSESFIPSLCKVVEVNGFKVVMTRG